MTGEDALTLGSVPSTLLEPIKLPSAAEQIAERLVTAIALGEFVPGQRLPTERELSAMLDVNRSAVHEALHRLADHGYLEIHRGRSGGAFVRSAWGPDAASMVRRTLAPRWEDLESLFDLRRLIEGMIAGTTAVRHTPADVAAIEAARDSYEAADEDREASRVADAALHTAIATATQNPHLLRLSQEIRARVSLGFRAEPYSADIRSRAIVQHAALVEAILSRDAALASERATEHFTLTEAAMRALLDRAQREGGVA